MDESRVSTGRDPNHSKINREERNYAAVFYAALIKKGNKLKLKET